MTPGTGALFQVEGATHVYVPPAGGEPVPALRGVSLEVAAGEFVALAGPSGSGKTTLLNLLGLLEPPQTGRVRVEGRDVAGLTEAELTALRRSRLGYILQTLNLVPVLTAYENVDYFLRHAGLEGARRRERVMRALDAVGVADLADRRPARMSGGQRQRVAIARVLARDVPAVLADEPTASLDRETGLSIIATMRTLNRERGVTFVFSSHDPDILAAAGRVIRLRDGRVAA